MNPEKSNTEKWAESTVNLVDAYRDLISIRISEHASLGISVSVIGILSLILAVFVLLFIGLGAAWWIGGYFNDMKTGFFLVGGVYMLIFGILLATSQKVLIPRIRNMIIKKIYEQD